MIEHDVAYGLEKAIELAPNDGCPITLTIGECESLVSRLRQAEKDAARYKDAIEAAGFDIGNLSSKLERADSVIFEVEMVLSERQKNGSFDCDDLLSEAQYYINNHQGVKE